MSLIEDVIGISVEVGQPIRKLQRFSDGQSAPCVILIVQVIGWAYL